MIESIRLNKLIEIGDRSIIETDGTTYQGFIKEVADDGVLIEWRDIEINANSAEQMVTHQCFIDRELIKTITKVK